MHDLARECSKKRISILVRCTGKLLEVNSTCDLHSTFCGPLPRVCTTWTFLAACTGTRPSPPPVPENDARVPPEQFVYTFHSLAKSLNLL